MTLLIEILLEIVVGLIGIFIEYKFRIINKLKKIICYVSNSPVTLHIDLFLKSKETPRDIGKEIIDYLKKQSQDIKIITDSKDYFSFTNNIYIISLDKIEKDIILKTSLMDTTMRGVQTRFSEILHPIESIKNVRLKSLGMTIQLPYRFEFVEIKTSSYVEIKDYNIKLNNLKWKSQLSLLLKNDKQNIQINGKHESEIYDIIKNIFKPI